jgi:hypothetical protein
MTSSMCSATWTTYISFILAVVYVGLIGKNLYEMMNPMAGVDISTISPSRTVVPLWGPEQKYRVLCFMSTINRFKPL